LLNYCVLGYSQNYRNITEAHCKIFVDTCPVCVGKIKKKKRKGARKPIRSSFFRDRYQLDLIDMREKLAIDVYGCPQNWVVVCKDHFTQFVILTCVPSKKPSFVAYELSKWFGAFGYPVVYQTDRGREVHGREVLTIVYQMNPHCVTLMGRPRTPNDQGSVERANQQIKGMFTAMEEKDRENQIEPNWTKYLGPIMAALNGNTKISPIGVAYEEEPYQRLFGMPYHEPCNLSAAELRSAKSIRDLMSLRNDKSFDDRLRRLVEVDKGGNPLPADPEYAGIEIHDASGVGRRSDEADLDMINVSSKLHAKPVVDYVSGTGGKI
jgi:hypothetical protein